MWLEIGTIALLTLGTAALMFLLAKLMGNRQVSQMTVFDYATGITIGSIAAELATELEAPLRPLTALVVYGLAAVGISLLTNKSIKARGVLTGKPLVLLEDGILYRDRLQEARLDLNEFLTYCRIGGWFDLSELQAAVLEHNGAISFLPKEQDRPAKAADLQLDPQQSLLQLPFILDGCLMEENIQQAKKEPLWVKRNLERQGYGSEEEVLLALWDGREGLTVFPMDPNHGKKIPE